MSFKTRLWFAEQILIQLNEGLRNRDEKIDPRECYVIIDQLINQAARQGFLENWKLGNGQIDELWITRFDEITITDPPNKAPSYFALPASYVNLPRLQGINSVTFMNSFTSVKKKYFDTVHIISANDAVTYRGNMAGSLQGRLSVYPKGGNMVFNTGNVGTTYGNVSIALVITDSSSISDTAPLIIPADIEASIITQAIEYFKARRALPVTTIRDNVDKT